MSILNPFSNQYTAWADVKQCYKTTYEKVDHTNDGKTYSVITPKNTSKFQKCAVVAKTIVILALSLVLFPVGAFVFRSLVNRMTLHKEDYTDKEGYSFKGTMRFTKFDQGQLTFPNGSTYNGQWTKPNKQGSQFLEKGTQTLANQTVYEGRFNEHGKLHGKGKITYPKPTEIVEEGYGILLNENGVFVNGNLEGNGKQEYLVDDKKVILDGQFKAGLLEGKGTQTSNGKLVYKGEWKGGDYEGYGQLFINGCKCVGEFKSSKFHGKGKLTKKDGSKVEGRFENGSFREGKWTNKDGTKLEGRFENGSLREGKWTKADGSVLEGTWDEDKSFTPKVQGQK